MSKRVTPRSTAVRINATASFFAVGGPRPKLSPMQPRPIAETSRPFLPRIRLFMMVLRSFRRGRRHVRHMMCEMSNELNDFLATDSALEGLLHCERAARLCGSARRGRRPRSSCDRVVITSDAPRHRTKCHRQGTVRRGPIGSGRRAVRSFRTELAEPVGGGDSATLKKVTAGNEGAIRAHKERADGGDLVRGAGAPGR